jgi:hypothetical protein
MDAVDTADSAEKVNMVDKMAEKGRKVSVVLGNVKEKLEEKIGDRIAS